MGDEARTAAEYLAGLPADRRDLVQAVADEVRAHLPAGYEESIGFGMLVWSVPLDRLPKTYNGKPLQYVALASQKRHCALYLNLGPDEEQAFRARWQAGGRTLDMGRSCLRFTSLDALDLDLLGETIAATPVEEYVSRYEASRA